MKILDDYMVAKDNLDTWKKVEADLRIKLLNKLFGEGVMEGTETEEVNGFKVKGGFSLNFKLDAKGVDAAFDELSEAEQLCISYKPSLTKAVYKALEDHEREALDEFITVSSAMPTIKIERLEE
tara:strand:- start:23044 stop:23415 length:372 start_codon:yes stop_codon:yes gene_type:complete